MSRAASWAFASSIQAQSYPYVLFSFVFIGAAYAINPIKWSTVRLDKEYSLLTFYLNFLRVSLCNCFTDKFYWRVKQMLNTSGCSMMETHTINTLRLSNSDNFLVSSHYRCYDIHVIHVYHKEYGYVSNSIT